MAKRNATTQPTDAQAAVLDSSDFMRRGPAGASRVSA